MIFKLNFEDKTRAYYYYIALSLIRRIFEK